MNFKTFFGIEEKDVKHNCIVCQNYDLSLFSDKTSDGLFAKCAIIENVTIISLKNNFLAGDAVLYLKNTLCENIFLFSSCGGCNGRTHGDIIIIDKAYNFESFSNMLNFKGETQYYQSTNFLFNYFLSKSNCASLIKANSACVSSLILEQNFSKFFKENGILIADMESSIVFSSAKDINRNVIGLTYVSDLIGQDFTIKIDDSSRLKIASSRKKLAQSLVKFCDKIEYENFRRD
jgi:hypothetical protein